MNTIEWNEVDVKFKYFAIDRDGSGYLYEKKPEGMDDDLWNPDYSGEVEFTNTYFNSHNWKNSLVGRDGVLVEGNYQVGCGYDKITINREEFYLVGRDGVLVEGNYQGGYDKITINGEEFYLVPVADE